MSATLEFFYDYVSAYSYVANSRMSRFDDVVYRPMFLGAVMEATGNRPPGSVPAKQPYLQQDLARWARRYSIPFKMNSNFPQNTLSALRLALVAQDKGTFDKVHQPLFDAMFVHDKVLADKTVLTKILENAGLPAEEYLEAIADPEIKERLKANTDEAIERGAFGAPTFFVGDKLFFGNDRFEFIEEALL